LLVRHAALHPLGTSAEVEKEDGAPRTAKNRGGGALAFSRLFEN
jgi:hypothetical protein